MVPGRPWRQQGQGRGESRQLLRPGPISSPGLGARGQAHCLLHRQVTGRDPVPTAFPQGGRSLALLSLLHQ